MGELPGLESGQAGDRLDFARRAGRKRQKRSEEHHARTRREESAIFASDSFEKKYDDEMDFSRCEGFQDEFMGMRVPMPGPGLSPRSRQVPG